jgi:hypothetical protein
MPHNSECREREEIEAIVTPRLQARSRVPPARSGTCLLISRYAPASGLGAISTAGRGDRTLARCG